MNQHIIITGASRGIGYETAVNLARRQINVTAIARSESNLKELKREHPGHIHSLPLDITDESASARIAEHLDNHSLRIDGFIHNAGVLINKPFLEQSRDDWHKQFEVNLMAPALLTRQLISYFNPKAHIVTISSMGGYQGSSKFPGLSAYSATKGGLSILTECLSIELADHQISCNSLCLGAVQTEMLEQAFPGFEAPVSAGEMGHYLSDFVLNGHRFYNGQILPVTLGDPG